MKNILKRLLFILLIWVPLLNMLFAMILVAPYFIITGKFIFDAKLFKLIMNLHYNLIEQKK